MEYIWFYILSILLMYFSLVRKCIFPIRSKMNIVLLNDAELRWGWGLITLLIEISTFLGVPYRIHRYSHEELNSYSEPSVYPLDTHLSQDLFFRDSNFWFFHEDNFERMEYFYRKNFPWTSIPALWITIPYSFIERIFIFPWAIVFHGISLQKKNLFRALSHITGDNTLPPGRRKFVLLGLIFHWWILLCIPFVPHYFFLIFLQYVSKWDIGISSISSGKLLQNRLFLWVNENNLIGRKGNRYMLNTQEFILHINAQDSEYMYWNGKILLRKSIQSEEHFPFVWEYTFSLDVVHSKHFTLLGGSNVYLSFETREDFIHEVPFTFCIPVRWSIQFLRQSCMQNTEIVVSMDTRPFITLPMTNLAHQHDHWHYQRWPFDTDFQLKYSLIADNSPIRMLYRAILEHNIVQLTFQKPIQEGGTFHFRYKGKDILYNQIDYHDCWRILIFHLVSDIPYYPNTKRKNTLKLSCSNIIDITGQVHYRENPRKIWFPWVNIWDK